VTISQRPSLLSTTPGSGSSFLMARMLIASRKAVSSGSSCMIPSNLLISSVYNLILKFLWKIPAIFTTDEDQSNPRYVPLMLGPSGSSAKTDFRRIIYTARFRWGLKWILLEELDTKEDNFGDVLKKSHKFGWKVTYNLLQCYQYLPLLEDY